MTTAPSRNHFRAGFLAAQALTGSLTGLFCTLSPAEAAPGGVYAAILVSPLAEPRREIVDGMIWRCEGNHCTAPADGARLQSICSKVTRKFGLLSHFTSPQGELTAAQLARCNGAN
jgi:hypothetical protein